MKTIHLEIKEDGICSVKECENKATTTKAVFHQDWPHTVKTEWPVCDEHGDKE